MSLINGSVEGYAVSVSGDDIADGCFIGRRYSIAVNGQSGVVVEHGLTVAFLYVSAVIVIGICRHSNPPYKAR